MQTKLAEYQAQQDKADKLKQAAIDEAASQLASNIENTFESIKQLKAIAPDYELSKLSKGRKLAAMFGLTESPRKERKTKSAKGKTKFSMSEEKQKRYLDFIGAGEKSTQEIQKHFKTKNSSNDLSFLRKAGKIVATKKEGHGKNKFWKKV